MPLSLLPPLGAFAFFLFWFSFTFITNNLVQFGYATDETPELLPLTLLLSHKLNSAMKEARNDGSLPWLRPDTKTQVTIEVKNPKVQALDIPFENAMTN